MGDRNAHWNGVYSTKHEAQVSWFQEQPGQSLELIRRCGLAAGAAVIDVGGGASRLVDALLDERLTVSVLDISAAALEQARVRLGDRAAAVEWLVSDITRWQPHRTYDLWHDRAVFHFLTEAADRAAYRARLLAAVPTGGHVVMGTFALDGPERCSGLPVVRYGAHDLAAALGAGFRLTETAQELHKTPGGNTQSFQFCRFSRT